MEPPCGPESSATRRSTPEPLNTKSPSPTRGIFLLFSVELSYVIPAVIRCSGAVLYGCSIACHGQLLLDFVEHYLYQNGGAFLGGLVEDKLHVRSHRRDFVVAPDLVQVFHVGGFDSGIHCAVF